MKADAGRPGLGRPFLILLLTLGWIARGATMPLAFIWRDWLFILLLGLIVLLSRPRRDPSGLLSALGAWLFAIYLMGQWPHLFSLWKAGP